MSVNFRCHGQQPRGTLAATLSMESMGDLIRDARLMESNTGADHMPNVIALMSSLPEDLEVAPLVEVIPPLVDDMAELIFELLTLMALDPNVDWLICCVIAVLDEPSLFLGGNLTFDPALMDDSPVSLLRALPADFLLPMVSLVLTLCPRLCIQLGKLTLSYMISSSDISCFGFLGLVTKPQISIMQTK